MRIPFSYDVDKQEFLCPLCETLANSVIPLIPQLPTLVPAAQTAVQVISQIAAFVTCDVYTETHFYEDGQQFVDFIFG